MRPKIAFLRMGRAISAASALLCACSAHPRSGVSDSTFVAAMADLRRVIPPPNSPVSIAPRADSGGPAADSAARVADSSARAADSARRAAKRDSILRHYGLSEQALEAKARELGRDPDRAVEILHAIDRKTYVSAPPPLPPGPPGPPSPPAGPPAATSAQTSSLLPLSRSLPGGRDTSLKRPLGRSSDSSRSSTPYTGRRSTPGPAPEIHR